MTHLVDIQPISDSEVKAGAVVFRPAYCPGVLDTATWDTDRANLILRSSASFLQEAAPRVMDGTLSSNEAVDENVTLFPDSIKSQNGVAFVLIRLRDGQRAFLALSTDKDKVGYLGRSFSGVQVETLGKTPSGELFLAFIPSDTDNVVYFVENIAPPFGPQPMGTTSRLGIGARMTSLVFPGAFDALTELRLPCNMIQNSIGRELAPVARLVSGEPLPQTYLPGLGTLHTGHTGTSIEGLWLEGTLWGIQLGASAATWGADADHAPVKRSAGSEGMDRAKDLLYSSRNYTFFTMDTSDLFDYRASKLEGVALQQLLEEMVPDPAVRQALLDRHTQKFDAPAMSGRGGYQYHPTAEQMVRFVIKYWRSLSATETLNQYIASLRGRRGYDFEFSMDERPLDISALESVTPDEEVIFVLRELQARGVRCTHVAPNFGVEKGVDYRLPDGLDGLESRSARMAAIAHQFSVTLDYHSGDDLARTTRQRIAQGTGGVLDYKISPILQTMYAEVLADLDAKRFRWWWETTRKWTEQEAARGEKSAEKYLKELAQREAAEGARFQPRVDDHFFWNYCFAIVGARGPRGEFLSREMFYEVSEEVKQEIRNRTKDYIIQLAQDVGLV